MGRSDPVGTSCARSATGIRVVLVTHYFSTHGGGIERVAGRLASMLTERNDCNIVWLASSGDPLPEMKSDLRCMSLPATHFINRLTTLPFPIPYPAALFLLAKAVRQAEIVHIHDFVYFGNIAAFAFAHMFGKPVVITQHVGAIPFKSLVLTKLYALVNRTLGRWMLGKTDRVTFIADHVMEYFSGFTSFKAPPLKIANGVDVNLFRSQGDLYRDSCRVDLGLDRSQHVVLFVGRFVEKKGLLLVRRMAELQESTLWLFAGWGPINPESWNLPNVRVFEQLEQRKLVPLYLAADCLVLPSWSEGFPLVIQEAMACGLSVVTTTETARGCQVAAPHLITLSLGGEDVEKRWLGGIDTAIANNRNPTCRDALAMLAQREWSWDRCADQYADLFRRMTKKGRRSKSAAE